MSLFPRTTLHNLDQFFEHPWSMLKDEGGKFTSLAPRVDVNEKNDSYEIHIDLPGVAKEDIHITLRNGTLIVEAETNTENKEEKGGQIIRQERHHGKFVRSFELGTQVHESDIRASHKNGVLTVTTPKHPKETESQKRITID